MHKCVQTTGPLGEKDISPVGEGNVRILGPVLNLCSIMTPTPVGLDRVLRALLALTLLRSLWGARGDRDNRLL